MGRLSQLLGINAALLLGIFAVRLVVDTSERLVYPFLTPIALGVGVSVTGMGVIISLRSWVGVVSPLLGLVADRYGKKRLMVFGLMTQLVGLLLMQAVSGWWVTLPMVIMGLGTVSFVPIQLAYVSDLVAFERRGRALAFVDMSFATAGIVALPIVGWLIDGYGWRTPYLVLTVLTVITTSLTIWLLPDAPVVKSETSVGNPFTGLGRYLKLPAVIASIILAGLIFFAFSGFNTVWALWLTEKYDFDTVQIGVMGTTVSLAELAGVIFSILFIDRIGKKRGIRIGFGLGIILFVAWLLIPHTNWSARINLMLIGGVLEFTIVSFFPCISDQLPEARATLFTLAGLGISAGLALGPAVNLFLWAQGGLSLIVPVMAGLLLTAILLTSRYIK